jgi:hypothetical protein
MPPCRADDLIPEESEIVLLAVSRLDKKEAYDRVFRMRRAMQVYYPENYSTDSDAELMIIVLSFAYPSPQGGTDQARRSTFPFPYSTLTL